MARAKRTDRAEARRRYRASVGEGQIEEDVSFEDADDEAAAPVTAKAAPVRARTAPAAPSASSTPPARPSIAGAFRSSFRPVDLRGDLRALPQLVRHWSFLLPVVLSGLSVALIPLVGLNALTQSFFQYFSFTAPLGTSFIAGFFAPRASYLVGILAALASVGFQAIAFSVGPFGGLLDAFTDTSGNPMSRDAAKEVVLSQALVTGVPSAALFAAAAAWYKRFLSRANPNRGRPASATSRRPDGKVAKKNQQRPILARRR